MTQSATQLVDLFEEKGRTTVQLAEELFALADLPQEEQEKELVIWANGLNRYEKLLAEAVMMTAAEDFGFSLES